MGETPVARSTHGSKARMGSLKHAVSWSWIDARPMRESSANSSRTSAGDNVAPADEGTSSTRRCRKGASHSHAPSGRSVEAGGYTPCATTAFPPMARDAFAEGGLALCARAACTVTRSAPPLPFPENAAGGAPNSAPAPRWGVISPSELGVAVEADSVSSYEGISVSGCSGAVSEAPSGVCCAKAGVKRDCGVGMADPPGAGVGGKSGVAAAEYAVAGVAMAPSKGA